MVRQVLMQKYGDNHAIVIYAMTLIFIALAYRSVNNMVLTTVPIFTRFDLTFSNFLSGSIVSFMNLSTFVSTLFLNPILKPELRRKLFILANFIIAVSLIFFSRSNSISVWAVSFCAGFAFGLITPNIITSASLRWDTKTRERLLTLFTMGLSISLIIGPVLETFMLAKFGYIGVFDGFIPFALLSLALSFLIKFPDSSDEHTKPKLFRNRALRISIYLNSTYSIPFAAIGAFLVIFSVEKFHVSATLAYSAFIPFFSVSFITRAYMMLKPFNSMTLPLYLSVIITLGGLVAFHFISNFSLLFIDMALLGIPHGITLPLSTVIISRGTNVNERMHANSYLLAYGAFISVITPALFAFLINIVGFSMIFSLLTIPSGIFVLLLYKEYRKTPSAGLQ